MSERVDLRLVPVAVAAWLAAALGTGEQAGWLLGLAAVLLGGGAPVLLAAAWPRRGRHRARTTDRVPAGLATAALACAAAGAVLAVVAAGAAAERTSPVTDAARRSRVVQVTGVLLTPARPTTWGTGVTASLRVSEVVVRGTRLTAEDEVTVRGGDGWRQVVPGTVVRATGRLDAVDGPWPAVLTAGDPATLGAPGPVAAAVARIRAGLVASVAGLPADPRGLVPGAAIGDTSLVEEELRTAMRAAGLSHLVAVSGQHVAVVVLAALAVAAWLRAPRWVRAGLAVATAVSFAVVVGGGPSVLRAVATGVVGAVALGLGRPARAVPALAAVVIAILVADPSAAASVGFQLSVVATAAIVVLARPAAVRLAVVLRMPTRLAQVVAVPLAAQSAVGPVLVLVDPVVTPWAVAANVVAAPAVVPATLAGLAATVAGLVHPGAGVLAAWLAAAPAWWIALVARTAAGLPGAGLDWRPGPAGALGLAALTAATWWAAWLVTGRGGRVHR